MSNIGQMTRTSMALDTWTVRALQELSEKWHLSKAEVIRRAVRQLHDKSVQEDQAPTPLAALDWLQHEGGMVAEDAERFRSEVKANREARAYWWEA